jgi:hypothetical protein
MRIIISYRKQTKHAKVYDAMLNTKRIKNRPLDNNAMRLTVSEKKNNTTLLFSIPTRIQQR